jgi:hypothetical protein
VEQVQRSRLRSAWVPLQSGACPIQSARMHLSDHSACGQFGGQEPGTDAEVAEFCTLNHGVDFPLMKKSDVNGDNTNDVYKYLKSQKSGLLGLTRIKVGQLFRPSPSLTLNPLVSGTLRNSSSTNKAMLSIDGLPQQRLQLSMPKLRSCYDLWWICFHTYCNCSVFASKLE